MVSCSFSGSQFPICIPATFHFPCKWLILQTTRLHCMFESGLKCLLINSFVSLKKTEASRVHSFEQLPIFQFPNFGRSLFQFSKLSKISFPIWQKEPFWLFFSAKRQHTWFSWWRQNWILKLIKCTFPKNIKHLNFEKSRYVIKLENWKTDFLKFWKIGKAFFQN